MFDTNKDYLPLAFLTLFLTLFSCYLFVKKLNAPMLPPGPKGLPLVGYLPFLQTNLHKQFTKLAETYGPIYKFWLGSKLCVVISSPSLVKEVVRDHDIIFSNRDPPVAALIATYGGNDIAFAPYSHNWRKLRKVFVQEMLSNSNLEAGYDLRRQEVKKGIKHVYSNMNTPTDFGKVGSFILSSLMTKVILGDTLVGDTDTDTDFWSDFKNIMAELMYLLGTPGVSDFFPVLAWFDLQGIKKRSMRINQWFDKLFESAIERCNNSGMLEEEVGQQRKSFLQLLLELEKNVDDATSINTLQLKALLMNIIVGGSDTTTTSLEWTMAELMKHPEIMKKVNEELDNVVGPNNRVEEHHLPNLHYLDSVIKENMRLHTPLPLLVPRCPSKDVVIGGYTILKGSRVFLNVGAIQRDPQLWDNPTEFVPERFLAEFNMLDFNGNNFQYLPFGSGRRICPGIPLADKMTKLVLGSLVHSFEWRLPEGEKVDLEDKFGIVVQKLKSLIIIPTPRLSKELYE